MQEDKVLKWLIDIQAAILEVEVFMLTNVDGFNGLRQNVMFKRALERNIEIIGEAVNRVLTVESEITIYSARRIVDARNFLIHEYEKVSEEVLWAIAVRHIRLLKVEVEKLLAERAE